MRPHHQKKRKISIQNLSKTFRIGHKDKKGALSSIISLFGGREEKRDLKVLQDISLEAYSGEVLGIIGKNGSGKSTLLRIIAGIYKADSGTVETEGKMIYLSGFGQGLKPKLTMGENIYLIGSLMGLGKKELQEQFDSIVKFSGLQEYVHTKVYQFSTGMLTRLNFSIGIHCLERHNPDILLVDEMLSSGGDIDFQAQAGKKIEELILGNTTVLLVSHNLNDIEKYCDRVIILEKGRLVNRGKPEQIIEKYDPAGLRKEWQALRNS